MGCIDSHMLSTTLSASYLRKTTSTHILRPSQSISGITLAQFAKGLHFINTAGPAEESSRYINVKCKPSAKCVCAVPLIDGLGFSFLYSLYPASSSRRVWHGLATVVDCMRELIHALRCDFCAFKSERTRSREACANLHISSLFCFSRHNFRTQNFYRNRYF